MYDYERVIQWWTVKGEWMFRNILLLTFISEINHFITFLIVVFLWQKSRRVYKSETRDGRIIEYGNYSNKQTIVHRYSRKWLSIRMSLPGGRLLTEIFILCVEYNSISLFFHKCQSSVTTTSDVWLTMMRLRWSISS